LNRTRNGTETWEDNSVNTCDLHGFTHVTYYVHIAWTHTCRHSIH